MGNSSLYFYSEEGKLQSSVDRVDSTFVFIYDTGDRVTTIGKSLYNRSTSTWVDNYPLFKLNYVGSNTVTVTDAMNNTNTIAINDLGNPVKIVDASGNYTTMGWDSNMNLRNFTDARGYTTSYEYDSYGNLIKQIDPEYNTQYYEWDTIDSNTQYISLQTEIENARGYTTSYEYDSYGNLINITDATGNNSLMEYDSHGRLTKETDFRDGETTYSYDTHGNMESVKDATDNSTLYDYDTVGRLIKITDANKHSSEMYYDDNDRLIKVKDSLGNEEEYEYNAAGTLLKTIDANKHEISSDSNVLGEVSEVEDPLGNKASFEYDKNGNLIMYTDADGANTRKAYDKLGRVISVNDTLGNSTNYTYDQNGNLLTLTDRSRGATSYEYDSLNRLTSITDPMGNKTSYSYDAVGNLVSVENANYKSTNYTYDSLDRFVSITDAMNGKSSFSYDANGNLLSHTNANGNSTLYEYDELNRRIKSISALGYETIYRYDPVGNIISKTDANYDTINYEYDELNRLTGILYPDGTAVTKEYDAVGNLVKLTGQDFIADLSYDELNRLSEVEKQYGSISKTISYGYDKNGNILNMSVNGEYYKLTTEYSYDKLNRITAINDSNNELTNYSYDAGGRKIAMERPNGVTTSYSYDAANNLASLVNSKSSGDVISSYSYTYDNVGNVLSITEDTGDATQYVYDALNRLKRTNYFDGNFSEYAYDFVGNRLSKVTDTSTTIYTYDAENRMQTSDGMIYTYDNNGNLVGKSDGTVYEYDYENRLTGVTLPDTNQVSYTYSPHGDRLSKSTSSGTTYYVYDHEDLIMEVAGNGVEQARYAHGPGIDDPVSMNRGGTSSYYLANSLGSITALTDASENTVATYKYDDFGFILEDTGSSLNPYKFTAREHDEDIGLYYYRARYYDSEIGRFISKDPFEGFMSNIQSLNRYCYVQNNPINYVDPSGNVVWWIPGAVGAGVSDIYYAGEVIFTDEEFSLSKLAGHTASGAVAPYAFAAGMLVGGPLGGTVAGGAVSGGASYVTDVGVQWAASNVFKDDYDEFSWSDCAYSVSIGAVAGPIQANTKIKNPGRNAKYLSALIYGRETQKEAINAFSGEAIEYGLKYVDEHRQSSSSNYFYGLPTSKYSGSDYCSIDDWVGFEITATSVKSEYEPGDTVTVFCSMTNIGDEKRTIWIGRSFKDAEGEVAKYDSTISLDKDTLTLDIGDTDTFTVQWTIPDDAPLGPYEIEINAWGDDKFNEDSERYFDTLEWKRVFTVVTPNVAPSIISPTASNPGQAGSLSKPTPIEVVVEVEDTVSGEPVARLLNEDFEFMIGEEKASSMLLDSAIPGEYTFRVEPPSKDETGIYDLEVSVLGMNSDTEVDAVKYYSTSNVDVVLVLDRSGSMDDENKMDDAKSAAGRFVDYMINGDKAGVISFSSSATYNYHLNDLTSDVKDDIKYSISRISAGGGTVIGNGLRYALNDFVYYGNTQHPWAIVLLSDGKNSNTDDIDAVVDNLKDENIKVFSVGLGSGADEDMLRDIADNSGNGGGDYYYAPSSTDLKEIYDRIVGKVTGQQSVCSYTETIYQGNTKTIPFPLSTSDNPVTMSVSSSQSDTTQIVTLSASDESTLSATSTGNSLDVILLKPDGSVINPEVAADDPDIEHVEEDTYEFYRVNNPDPGVWNMEITAVNVPTSGAAFKADVQVSSTLYHSLSTDRDQYSQGENPKLLVSISEQGLPITGATVITNVTLPDSSVATLKLYDDGGHGDVVKDDGVYANYFQNTSQTGEYTVEALTVGTNDNNEQFSREEETVFEVNQGQSLIELVPEDIHANVSAEAQFTFNGSVSSSTSVAQWVSLISTSLQSQEGYNIDASSINITPDVVQISDTSPSNFKVEIEVPSDAKSGFFTGNILATSAAGSDQISLNLNITAIEKSETVVSSGSGGGGGGGTTGEEYENIAYKGVLSEFVSADSITSYEFDDEQNTIEYIRFEAFRNWGKISSTIEMLHGTSALVDEDAPDTVYCNVNLWVGKSGFSSSDNIDNPVVGFEVEKDWIEENEIDEGSIRLCRYSDGQWGELDTQKLSEDDTYLHFEASTPGFSPFAIVGTSMAQEAAGDVEALMTVEDVVDDTPVDEESVSTKPKGTVYGWFAVGFASIVLIGGFVVLAYRKRD